MEIEGQLESSNSAAAAKDLRAHAGGNRLTGVTERAGGRQDGQGAGVIGLQSGLPAFDHHQTVRYIFVPSQFGSWPVNAAERKCPANQMTVLVSSVSDWRVAVASTAS